MYDIIMDIVNLDLEYEPFERINETLDSRETGIQATVRLWKKSPLTRGS